MKIKSSLIIITAVLLIVSTVVFGVFLGIQLDSTAVTMYETYLSDMSSSSASSLQLYLDNAVSNFKSLSQMPSIETFTSGTYSATSTQGKAAQEYIDALVETSAVKSVLIYNKDNEIILSAGVAEGNIDAESVCVTGAEDFQPVITTLGSENSKYALSLKAACGNYNLAVLYDQENTGVRTVLKQCNSKVYIVDPMGAIITQQSVVGNISTPPQQYAPYKDAVVNATSNVTRYSTSDSVAFVTETTSGWAIVANDQINAAKALSSVASRSIIGIAVTLCVIFFVAGIILIIIVTKPFYRISETIQKISRGDHEARIDIMSKNEYGDIARVFNDIMDNIIISESRYRTIIDMSDNIIFEWNFHNNEVTFSNNFNKKFSYRAPSDHFADSFLLKCKVHPEDAERYKADLEKLAKGENFKRNEYRWKNIYGDYIWVLIRTATINDIDGTPLKVVGVIVDIDRAKKSENMLTARASFDALTNVYNRETIESAINNEIELIAVRKTEFAILFVDIDDFKFYNDQYSHATGDQVLRFTATTIKNAIGENGLAGRYGGDEFIICLKNSEENDPALIAEQILATLKDGFDNDSGDHLSVNVSIGISIIRDNSKRVDEIIGQADDAMYKIKKNGKSNYGFLDS